MAISVSVENLQAWYGHRQVLQSMSLAFPAGKVTAIIGPSGCGKSTLLRCLNRMHEVVPEARTAGRVLLDGEDIYAPGQDPVRVRRLVGMVFQRPNPFPNLSVFENVAAGLLLNGQGSRRRLAPLVESSLKQAGLWDEVRDRLGRSATQLSGGQQQRLCIARALAVKPKILLMDEPASALDPISTARVEDLINELKSHYTIVIVTHNMQQAGRVSDDTAFLLNGELVEHGPTSELFTRPRDSRTEAYVTGRFG